MLKNDNNPVQTTPQKQPTITPRPFNFRRLVFLMLRVVLFLVFLFVLLVTLIQWSPVQKRLVDYTSHYFSKELNSTVKINALVLSLSGTLDIKKIYLSAQNSPTDTILAVDYISVRLNPTFLVWGILQVNQLVISDATVKLKRQSDSEKFNFDFIVDYFSSNKKDETVKTKKPLPDIRFSKIRLRHINFSLDDKYDGKFQQFAWEDALVTTNFVNLPKRLIDVANVDFKKLFVKIQEVPMSPLALRNQLAKIKLTPSSPSIVEQTKLPQDTTSEKPFRLSLGALTIENSMFALDKYDNSSPRELLPHNIDFDHMQVNNIDIYAHNIFYSNWEWEAVLDGLSAKEKSGFEILKFTVGDVKVTPTTTELIGLRLETPNSIIGDTFKMTYSNFTDFRNYNNAVFMDAHINNAQIRLDDIMAFAPDLARNAFFQKNRKEIATLNGLIKGKVNNLKANPFKIEMQRNFYAEGIFEGRDLTNKNETFIHLELRDLKTDVLTLRSLIPNFDLTPSFNKFSNIDFTGEFVGFYTDFTAKGKLNSDIGSTLVDMKLVPGETLTAPTVYSGFIELRDFDLGNFTDNADLGKLNMRADIIKGVGFVRDKLNIDINSTIYNVSYKNYAYKDINTTGTFNQKKFVGKVESKDPNAAFTFDGSADIAAQNPVFDFKTQILKIDFKKLGLMTDDIVLAATSDLNFSGGRLSQLLGSAQFKNVRATKNGNENYDINDLVLSVVDNTDGTKEWRINSELGNATLRGKYNIEDIPDLVLTHFQKFHPKLAPDLKLVPKVFNTTPTNFTFNIALNDTKNWTKLFEPKLGAFKSLDIQGNFNNVENTLLLNVDSKNDIQFDNIAVKELGLTVRATGETLNWDMHTETLLLGDNVLNDITFQNFLQGDSLEFGFTSKNLFPKYALKTVEINALLYKTDSSYSLSFGANQLSKLQFFDNSWSIEKANRIEFFRDSFAVNNFDLSHDSAHIYLKSVGRRGLSAAINNLDIAFVDSFVRDPRFTMRGKYQFDAAFNDILHLKDYTASLHLDSFFVKNEYRGATTINASGKDFQEPIVFNAKMVRNTENFDAQGKYFIAAREGYSEQSIDVTGNFDNFAFDALHYIIDNGASEFRGGITGALRVHGPLKKINTDGQLRLKNGHAVVDYLKLPINVKDALITVTNTRFDATGDSIFDAFGNYARVTGGLTHDRFKHFGLDLQIASPNFLFLDTKRTDNSFYYGRAIGAGTIDFSGDFDKADIRIRASASKGTNVVFPFANENAVKEASFINFKNVVKSTADSTQFKKRVNDVTGINLEMAINIKPEAELTLIFNEATGDKIRGSGTGDINFALNRTGNVTMDGEARIDRGDYSFSMFNFVQKNFTLKPGGTIRWSGSPFDAEINIEAEYKGLNTSPYYLVAEYVENDNSAKSESLRPTPVNLTLHLTDALLHPNINFDIDFPNPSSNLKGFIENKLSILRTDANELNKQVSGLIVVGSFLPTNVQNWSNAQLQNSGINTVTQSISSFLSDKLTKVISEYITGLDLEVGYDRYQYDVSDNKSSVTGQQFRFHGSYALSDRASLRGGFGVESGDIASSVSGNNNVFIGSDFVFEYAINADRRLRLRVSYIHDQVFEGSRNKAGIGLLFRNEFDTISLGDIFKFLKKPKPIAPKSTPEKPTTLN